MKWLLDSNSFILCKKKKLLNQINNLQIYTTIFNLIEYPPIIHEDNVTIYYPNAETYDLSLKYAIALREKGKTIGPIDILIASLAILNNCILVSNDKDFSNLVEMDKKLQLQSLDDFLQEAIQKKE